MVWVMRLSKQQREVILRSIRERGTGERRWMLRSRADDAARGGDIDLLVVSGRLDFRDHWPIRRDILDAIGWQKLDLIVQKPDQPLSPIARIARESGIPL